MMWIMCILVDIEGHLIDTTQCRTKSEIECDLMEYKMYTLVECLKVLKSKQCH